MQTSKLTDTSQVHLGWVLAVVQLKFENSELSQKLMLTSERHNAGLKPGRGWVPRLVRESLSADTSAGSQSQVALLAKASLLSMEAIHQVVQAWQRQGRPLSEVYLDGIAPGARLLGEWWTADTISFVDCTIAMSRLHRLMYDCSAEFLAAGSAQPNGFSVLLMTEPGSQHSLGIFMLSEFFKQAGWHVTLAAPPHLGDFRRYFQSDWFDAVGLSLSSDRYLDDMAKLLPELMAESVNSRLQVFVGGPMSELAPEKLTWPGTLFLRENAQKTVEILTQAMHFAGPSSFTPEQNLDGI